MISFGLFISSTERERERDVGSMASPLHVINIMIIPITITICLSGHKPVTDKATADAIMTFDSMLTGHSVDQNQNSSSTDQSTQSCLFVDQMRGRHSIQHIPTTLNRLYLHLPSPSHNSINLCQNCKFQFSFKTSLPPPSPLIWFLI